MMRYVTVIRRLTWFSKKCAAGFKHIPFEYQYVPGWQHGYGSARFGKTARLVVRSDHCADAAREADLSLLSRSRKTAEHGHQRDQSLLAIDDIEFSRRHFQAEPDLVAARSDP